MSSTRTLLDDFLSQFYNVGDIDVRILSGHERLVKETRDINFMQDSFSSDVNPNFKWLTSQCGSDTSWIFKPGTSWIFGRNKELRNYRQLLSDPSSGLIGVWASPRHIPSLSTSVEVWKKGSIKTDLLEWQEVLCDKSRVNGLIDALTKSKEDNSLLFRGYYEVVSINDPLRKMGRWDQERNCEGLFGSTRIWRPWDLALLAEAADQSLLLVSDESKDKVIKAMKYRWNTDDLPSEVITDSVTLKELFPSWEYADTITSDHTGVPCVFLNDRLLADEHINTSGYKNLILWFQARGKISSKKLLSRLKIMSSQVEDSEGQELLTSSID